MRNTNFSVDILLEYRPINIKSMAATGREKQ